MAEGMPKRTRLRAWIHRPADDVPRTRKRDILLLAACKIVDRVSHQAVRSDATTRGSFVSSMFSSEDLDPKSSPSHPVDPVNVLPLAEMLDQLVHVLARKLCRFQSQEFRTAKKSAESSSGSSSQATEVATMADPGDSISEKDLSDDDEERFFVPYDPPRLCSVQPETLAQSGYHHPERNLISNGEHPLFHEESQICDQTSESSTESTHSETETDWADDESDGSYVDFEVMKRIVDSGRPTEGSEVAFNNLVLTPVKQQLVDRLMGEFWVIFDREWQTNVTSHAGTPQTSSPSQASGTLSSSTQRSASGSGMKRHSAFDRDRHPDDDEQENPKRRNVSPSSGYESYIYPKFSCPYRKHDPMKYNITDWRICALTPQSTIARVKGHLYRHHRIFQCLRCKQLFKSQDELDAHFTAIISCELNSDDVAEGITVSVEKRLRSRKKTHRDQTEEDRWREIYQILFPEDDAPSPYFDHVQEGLLQSTESLELANYGDYSRRELPRLFRSILETAVNDEAQPIEERLRGQLTSMIQECQDRVFSNYRALRIMQPTGSNSLPGSEARSANTVVQMEGPSANPQLSALGPHLETHLQKVGKGGQFTHHGRQEPLDSGYGSNKSASESSLGEYLEKTENLMTASSDTQSPTPNPSTSSGILMPPSTKTLFYNSVHDPDMAQFFSMEDVVFGDGDQDMVNQELFNWNSGWGIDDQSIC